MGKEIDDIEFDDLLAEKRHRELTSSLKGIATLLNKPNDNSISEALNKNAEATRGLIQAVKDIPKPEKPEVNVEISQQEIVTSLKTICKEICDSNDRVIEALANKPMVEEFKIQNTDNWTKTVKVVYKPANQITFKK